MPKFSFSRTQSLVILIILLVVGLAARLYKINDHGIWMDEKTSLRAAVGLKDFNHIYNQTIYDHIPTQELKQRDDILNKHPFTSTDYWERNTLANVKNAIVLDNSNSLTYAFYLHFWVNAFGTSDFFARLFSLLFGMLTLVLAYIFSKRFLGNTTYALIMVALLVPNCWLILNCQLVRTYAFTTFFAFLSSAVFFAIIFKQKNGWLYPVYAFAVLMALGGHHMTAYVFACHALIAVLFLRNKETWINLVLTAIPVLVLYGLWVGKFGADGFEVLHWKNLELALRAKLHPESKFPGVSTPKNVFGGVVNYLNMILGTNFLRYGLRIYMILIILAIPFGLVSIVYVKATDALSKKLIISTLIIIFAAPMLSAAMAFQSHTAIPFTLFYAAYAIPLGAFLLALCISRIQYLKGNLRHIGMGLASLQVLFILLSFPTAYKEIMTASQTPNPYMIIAKNATDQYQPGDTLVHPSWNDAEMANIYLRQNPEIQQDVDSSLVDKVVLLRNGKKLQLFDFENNKYRY